ncbi:MAG: ParA family protein [Bacteroidales bacterium]|nr:ParA family protein [Bacteroidales bacterium]
MAETFIFFTVKGGTGKTSIATLFSSWLDQQKKKVLCVDADAPAYNLYNLRQRELSEYQTNPEAIDRLVPEDSHSIYPIIKLGSGIEERQNLIHIKQKGLFDYIVVDFPGSLTDSNAIALIKEKFVDHAILPTILDTSVIVSNIKAASQLKNFIQDVRFLWNNVLYHEKEEIYNEHTQTIQQTYGIGVCHHKVKSTSYMRREYGSDQIFIKSTLCYPAKTLKDKKLDYESVFNELINSKI